MTALTEDDVLERLASPENLNDFLLKANEILFQGIKSLLPYLFINNDEDIQEYAVKPLLAKSGPLDSLDVSLRLIYALGQITKAVYADILLFSQLSEHLQETGDITEFHDDIVYEFMGNLNAVTQNKTLFQMIEKMKFSDFTIFNQTRYGNMVKTGLTLAVTSLLQELTYESGT
ncbi:MltR family transcriptional regulator [Yersinia intermedia]|jgi:DNA-binding MltR family transcriptional regulator|uniref:MltR family transcriptional regulator n=1 Tax=Yersinia intermedia TaxID=631 RepID=UPI0005DF80AF|nr:MltR family transcriptional regulator [Yersinia intermedia]MCB5322803.1 transcriptional regulator [Yersinia intermedia]MCW8114215.1 MltR family transcriptional regulator [Yersinia intermedia]MDA5483366.1 MltR family transcriptional regulator [Yersinia intermedia]MDA5518984.1 MltR family transcriptional regulator [Yersinia intermedia]OWF87046.1 transcriptional regulator [Yersinia intermedia]